MEYQATARPGAVVPKALRLGLNSNGHEGEIDVGTLLDGLVIVEDHTFLALIKQRDIRLIRAQLSEWSNPCCCTFNAGVAKTLLAAFERLHGGGA